MATPNLYRDAQPRILQSLSKDCGPNDTPGVVASQTSYPKALADIACPEKDVFASSLEQLRDLLETDFKAVHTSTTLDRIKFNIDGSVEVDDKCCPFTPSLVEALAYESGIPIRFAYSISPDLFRENFERLKHIHSKAVTVCSHRGVAISLAPGGYRPARTQDVLDGLLNQTTWELKEARLCDRGVDLSFVEPGRTVSPEPGDIVECGVRISNSETGYPGLKGSHYTMRLVCNNGAVMTDKLGSARWGYDRRVAYETSIRKFQADLLKLNDDETWQLRPYGPHLRRHLSDREVSNIWRRMRAMTIEPVRIDSILGLDGDARQNLQLQVRERIAGTPDEPTMFNLWDLHNRITSAAKQFDFACRARLQLLGGNLLTDGLVN